MADQKLTELTALPDALVSTDTIYVVRGGVDYQANISALGDAALLDVGTTAGTVAAGDHTHTGVYEAANANIQEHIANVANPHGVNKTQVGLGNVTNDAQTKAAIVPNDTPAAGQLLVGNAGGTAYANVALSGDATLASTGELTLANTGASAGTYANPTVTIDAKGRVTNISNGTGGTGTGTKTIARWIALDNNPPAANYATIDTRNSIPVLDFDDGSDSATADEAAIFLHVVPEAANIAAGVNVYLTWAATTANSGNVVWEVALARLNAGNQDLDSYAFDTATLSTNSVTNATVGVMTTTTISVAVADTDGISAGDPFAMRVIRKETNAGDSMSGDAELVSVEVRSAA